MGCPFLFTKVEHTIIWLYSSICLKEFIMTSTNTPILAGNLDPKLKSRVLFLTDVVDDVSVMKVIEDIIEINENDNEEEKKFLVSYEGKPVRKPIVLEIMSPGGTVRDGLALIATIEQSKTPVITRVNGYAYSMALTIFLAGHERHMSRHASLMYHQVSGGMYGCIKSLEERLEVMQDLQRHLEDYTIERTKWKRKDLNRILQNKEDHYLKADQALFDGFITKIV